MALLGELASSVTSKNAGPFWITIDIRCGDRARFEAIRAALTTEAVAARCGVAPDKIKRFDIAELSVVKLSLHRPVVQGALSDRDMHGAQHANLLREMDLAVSVAP
jgi:hypothetical protein